MCLHFYFEVMALDENAEHRQKINHGGSMKICVRLHGSTSSTQNHNCQPHGGARGKVRAPSVYVTPYWGATSDVFCNFLQHFRKHII